MNKENKELLNKAKTSLANGLMIGTAVGSIIGRSRFSRHGINDSRRIIPYPA